MIGQRPTRILVLNAPEEINGQTWWRMYRPLALMHRAYPDLQIVHNETGILYPHHFQYADLCLIFRPTEPAHVAAMQMARDAGIPVIADYDDDLINFPIGHSARLAFVGKEPNIRHAVALATQVWTSTAPLGEVYAHPNTMVIPNAVLPSDLPDAPSKHQGIVAWRGGELQKEDLDMFRSQYVPLLGRVKGFMWMGYCPTWAADVKHTTPIRVVQHWVPTPTWLQYLQQQHLQAMVKPLMHHKFNESKSNIAWVEATCAGAVCITNFAGRPGWENATQSLPRDEAARCKIWAASRERILQEYNLEYWNAVRYEQIMQAVAGPVYA